MVAQRTTHSSSSEERLCFGPFCLDRAQGRLLAGDDERPVALTPKAFDLLH